MKKAIIFIVGLILIGIGFSGIENYFPLNLIPAFIGGSICARFFNHFMEYLEEL